MLEPNDIIGLLEDNPEYVEIADEESLLTVDDWDSARNIRALIALFLGEVRLIDNLRIR